MTLLPIRKACLSLWRINTISLQNEERSTCKVPPPAASASLPIKFAFFKNHCRVHQTTAPHSCDLGNCSRGWPSCSILRRRFSRSALRQETRKRSTTVAFRFNHCRRPTLSRKFFESHDYMRVTRIGQPPAARV